jgi:imidazole glycerol-phosphate synthase subunit HisH
MTIGIVDIGIGNLGSVRQALYNLGLDVVSVSSRGHFADISHLILPGVGAFAVAMEKLNCAGLVPSIQKFALDGRPVLGICLGMQLLASQGTEDGVNSGLDLIPGIVKPINASFNLRVPHVGWNEAHQKQKHPLLKNIRDDVDFYFVHSFKFVASNQSDVLAETEYGERFASIVCHDNIAGTQFHPEKSQSNGIRLLENFCSWDGNC